MTIPEPDFEQVFTENYERLVRTLAGITGDQETARDCVQEAFVKASTRWRRVRRYDDPVGWVRRVAINRSRDIHRANTRRKRREVQAMPATDSDGDDPGNSVGRSLDVARLLGTLPERQREAASLYYVGDLPVAEIASILGISAGAVKYHLSEARAALRLALEEQEEPHG